MANEQALQNKFKLLEEFSQGSLGVSAIHIETKKEINFNAEKNFLMCSTCKLPIAIFLLEKVQNNEINLNELCEITEFDLHPGIMGTLNQFNYDVAQHISLHNLLRLMMQESCNSASDIILKRVGGPNAVIDYFKTIDLPNINVSSYMLEAISAWDGVDDLPQKFTLAQYKEREVAVTQEKLKSIRATLKANIENTKKDTATPMAMTTLLVKLFKNELINHTYSELLLNIMRGCKRGPLRLMGMLSAKTPVAHKTGTLTGYTCDVGIITLPNNFGHVAISVYVKDSKKDLASNERIIAEVSRTIYDCMLFI